MGPAMKKNCAVWIGLFFSMTLVLGVWFLICFPESPPDTSPRLPPLIFRIPMAFGAAFIGGFLGIMAVGGLDGVRTRMKERASILKSAAARTLPVDGAFQAFFGRMPATGPMLKAPLSDRECLLYHYSSRHSGNKEMVTDVEGYALTPSCLDTPYGRLHVLSHMELAFNGERIDTATARERLRTHLASADLFHPTWNFKRNYQESLKHLLDNDGSIRYDEGRSDAPDVSTYFQEKIVQHGDEVAIFGNYSSEKSGIVPDSTDVFMHLGRLRKGSVAQISGSFVKQACLAGVIGTIFAAGLCWWIFAFFKYAPGFI